MHEAMHMYPMSCLTDVDRWSIYKVNNKVGNVRNLYLESLFFLFFLFFYEQCTCLNQVLIDQKTKKDFCRIGQISNSSRLKYRLRGTILQRGAVQSHSFLFMDIINY